MELYRREQYLSKIRGFHVVEFYNKYHPDPHFPEDTDDDMFDGMFRFQKRMKPDL